MLDSPVSQSSASALSTVKADNGARSNAMNNALPKFAAPDITSLDEFKSDGYLVVM
jgi:hypothetical protein